VWVEAESSKVGDRHLSPALWRAMTAAGGVELDVPVGERAAHLLREYRHFTERPMELKDLLAKLRYRLGKETVADWCAAIDAGRWADFVAGVLERHYDPAYSHSRERAYPNVRRTLAVSSLSEEGVRRAAAELVAGEA
jgi:tRNA 2-selenouridine synthase